MWPNPQETADLVTFTEKKPLMENFIFFLQWVCWTSTLTSKQHKSLPATNERNMEK